MLHKETVTDQLIQTARLLCSIPELASFRIVGGTAVALQLGHRISVDIDFFSNEIVSKKVILNVLTKKFNTTDFFVGTDRVNGEINGVRVELYDNWMIPFKTNSIHTEDLRLASLEDLAGFKLNAITERREKKDYIDLFFLFKKLGISSVLEKFKEYNPFISHKSILFALSEVKTAEQNSTPMPDMLLPANWNEINQSMLLAAKSYLSIIEYNTSKN
ncbi:MAG: nucleotidyl transferase AbiEii/AbiGii toxin family protein [Cyclobacteriaceae bacterium]|nr:nucleotidyl transferase AbiEii/AbiGii toxin family protein [Cyclobacteriaceae bacterium]